VVICLLAMVKYLPVDSYSWSQNSSKFARMFSISQNAVTTMMIKMKMTMMIGMHNGDENVSGPPADFEGPSKLQLFR